MSRLRIIFMGTAPLSRVSLAALIRRPEFEIVLVVSQPDRPKGRDLKIKPTPVKELALQHGLPVLQPEKARHAPFIEELRRLTPDLIVVAAYGHILPPAILDLPPHGCINVHTSLLPKYRGAAPIQWAIAQGETETGVTIMKMDAGMDTGAILAQTATPIHATDDAQSLHDRLASLGGELLVATIPDYVTGRIQPRPQPAEGVSSAPKIKKEDGQIDWRQPAQAIWNRMRAFTPWPGAFTHWLGTGAHQLLKLWKAEVVERSGAEPGAVLECGAAGVVVACGEGALCITELQLEGGRRMQAREFLAGHSLKPGERLG